MPRRKASHSPSRRPRRRADDPRIPQIDPHGRRDPQIDAALVDTLEGRIDAALIETLEVPPHVGGPPASSPPRDSPRIDAALSRPILDESSEALIIRLQDLRAPACFIRLLHWILHVAPVRQHVTHAEYFAGGKEVTAAHARAGHVAASFELLDGDDESQNMLSNIGFVNACRMSCSVIDAGAATSAPVCSSFVFMNSAVAKRCHGFPLGDVEVPSVAAANIMVARVLLLHWIFMSRMIFCVLEQPSSSWMQYHVQFQDLLGNFALWRHSICMKDFEAPSLKPSWLYSSHSYISHVDRFHGTMVAEPVTLAQTCIDAKTGKKCVNGTKDLKASQAYTRQFAWALLQAYRQNKANILEVAHAVRSRTLDELREKGPRELQDIDMACSWWKAARLDMVFAYLKVPPA